MVIAIDGPAGTGKSTIASRLSKDLGLTYLNSGSFYRALTLALLDAGVNTDDEKAVIEFASKQNLDYQNGRLILNGKDVEDLLHQDKVDSSVSKVSSVVELRHFVNERMRQIVKSLDIICEGRDMTTVVFPDADFKFYLDARPDIQAKRRYEQGVSGLSLEEIKEAIIKRDENDKNKKEGSLKKAKDAFYIDTSDLTINDVCAIIISKIQAKGFYMDNEVEKNVAQSSGNVHAQLEASIESMEPVEDGSLVKATVIQVTNDTVFVDVNCKSEGKIPVSEFEDTVPKEGDVIQVFLERQFGKNGPIVSKKKAEERLFWEELSKKENQNTVVSGKIVSVVKGGYTVELTGGINAFLPISQADIQRVEDESKLLGLESKFYIEKVKGKRNIVLSRRRYLEEQITERRNKFFDTVKIGDTVKGTVKSFTSFGAFIDLGGFDGLLHVNDMSWGHVTRPRDFVKKGETIELKVIRLDKESKRINLSLKHFTEDPWLHFEEKYHVGDIVTGKVTKVPDFGAFIELEDGIEGLAHISEFSWTKSVEKPSDMVKEGDEVKCMILGYDIQGGRVSLGLKQTTPNPWDTINETYPVGKKVSGTVVTIIQTGAFIRLEKGIDAFLSPDDISWTQRVKHIGDALKVGDTVDCVVLDCNSETRRIRVGIKQLSENPWEAFAKDYKAGSTFEGEVSVVNDFGIFVKTPTGLDGLVNKSNVSEDPKVPFEEAKKNFKPGDKVNVYVVSVDPERRRIALSVRDYKLAKEKEEISRYMSSNKDDSEAYTIGDSLKDQSENE